MSVNRRGPNYMQTLSDRCDLTTMNGNGLEKILCSGPVRANESTTPMERGAEHHGPRTGLQQGIANI